MSRQFDQNLVSAYLDGELDSASMMEAEAAIASSKAARDYVIRSIKTQARLKSSMNHVLEEEIPDRLMAALEPPQIRRDRRQPLLGGIFRVAAAVVLLMIGVLSGSYLLPQDSLPGFSPDQLQPYQSAVNEALEYNLSGTGKTRQFRDPNVTVVVTPVRTYRHRDGRYFREFSFELTEKGKPIRVNGLAYRAGKGRWNTKAIFF